MSNEIQFKCEFCEKEFPADPETMIEWEMKAEYFQGAVTDEMGITQADLESANEFALKAIGITEDQRKTLLSGGEIKYGGCICIECQDAMEENQTQFEQED